MQAMLHLPNKAPPVYNYTVADRPTLRLAPIFKTDLNCCKNNLDQVKHTLIAA